MSNQPQASVHKSTTWSPLAAGAHQWGPPTTHPWHTAAGGTPETVVFVCASDLVCHFILSPRPASAWGSFRTNSRVSAGGQILQLSPSPCVRVRSLRRLSFPFRWQCALNLVYTVIPFWKLEASNWDDSAEQKWVRVITIEVFFLGQTCGLRVLCMNVLWETSKEHHSQFGVFKECSFQPSKGHLFKVHVGFCQNLV